MSDFLESLSYDPTKDLRLLQVLQILMQPTMSTVYFSFFLYVKLLNGYSIKA